MRYIFALLLAAGLAVMDALRGRKLAVNVLTTEYQTKRGTGAYFPDEAITFENAGVKVGSSDRNFTLISEVTDVPLGILDHDVVATDEAGGAIPKNIAIFGVYPETLAFVASGAIAADAEVIPDPANPGQFKQLPDGLNGSTLAAGTYYVVGRNRFNIAAANDPTQPNDRGSLIHETPRIKVVASVTLTSAQITAAPTEANYNALQTDVAAIKAALGI